MSREDSHLSEVSKSKKVERDGQTPLMAQYFKIKEANPDTILLFIVGDFF
jgi:hypothetical protein